MIVIFAVSHKFMGDSGCGATLSVTASILSEI